MHHAYLQMKTVVGTPGVARLPAFGQRMPMEHEMVVVELADEMHRGIR